jgi:hypothetical protein
VVQRVFVGNPLEPPEIGFQTLEIAPDLAIEDRVARVLPDLSGSAHGWQVFSPGSGRLRVTGSPELPLELPVFSSGHRPQRIGSPGFRVSPHGSTGSSLLNFIPCSQFSLISLSISRSQPHCLLTLSFSEEKKKGEEMKNREEVERRRKKNNKKRRSSRGLLSTEEKKEEKKKRKKRRGKVKGKRDMWQVVNGWERFPFI